MDTKSEYNRAGKTIKETLKSLKTGSKSTSKTKNTQKPKTSIGGDF